MSPEQASRAMALISAFSLILMAVLAGIGIGYAFPQVYVAGDAAATTAHLRELPAMFQVYFICFLAVALLDLVLSFSLYQYFRKGNETLAMIMGLLRLAYTCMLGIALFNLSSVFSTEWVKPNEASILNQMDTFLKGWSLSLIVFGGHLLLLGLLCWQSGLFPRALAGLLLFSGICYMGVHLVNQLMPDFAATKEKAEMVLGLPLALSELGLALWLMLRGGKPRKN